jgi:MioC protein
MPGKMIILVGTMTGTAELVAEEIRDTLSTETAPIEVVPMDALDETIFARGTLFLICSSTYGQGDVPDNARVFFEVLEARRPDLAHVTYGVIALGDSTYAQTYCHGGLTFDRLLTELGASRAGEPMLHDASSGTLPEMEAIEWTAAWLADHVAELTRAA